MDKTNGEMHTYVSKEVTPENEVVLNEKTTKTAGAYINKAMHESGLDQKYNVTFGEEVENNNSHFPEGIKDKVDHTVDKRSGSLNKAIAKAVAKASQR